MGKNRLEAFSDGVIAIIITVMVLEMKIPRGADWAALRSVWPVLLSYLLSYLYVGIYWNNHHHLIKAIHRVNGGILWANLHLLFWLSLFPFVTAWVGQNISASVPMALYGAVLLLAGFAYYILQTVIVAEQGKDSKLARALGYDWKGKLSIVIYAIGIAISLIRPILAAIIYSTVALMWLVPDKRVEKVVEE